MAGRIGTSHIVAIALGVILASTAIAGPIEDYERERRAFSHDDLMGAMHWLRRAAEADHTPAPVLLAYILDRAEQDREAVELFQRAADRGDADAMYGLAGMYANGEGVGKDEARALHWYRSAAALDHEAASMALAEALLKGDLGLTRDPAAAIRMLEGGAARGHEPAVQRLARMRSERQ